MPKSRPFQKWTHVVASFLATSETSTPPPPPQFCRVWHPVQMYIRIIMRKRERWREDLINDDDN